LRARSSALRRALLDDAQAEIQLAMRVGLLRVAGRSRGQIAEKVGASRSDLQAAYTRIERAAPTLDRAASERARAPF
jgi:hypothetical protein